MSKLEEQFRELFSSERTAEELKQRAAAAMATLLRSDRYGGAKLAACRSNTSTGNEVIIIDLAVALGQRQVVNDIRATERVAVVFHGDGRLPQVYPLRDDFPAEVPHLNISGDGEPRSLCLFDMPVDEAVRLATPLVLLERSRFWLRETAYGRLHGEDQPLDPLFARSTHALVLPQLRDGEKNQVFVGYRCSEEDGFPILFEHQDVAARSGLLKGASRFAAIIIETQSLPHGRIRALPNTIGQLIAVYRDLGTDISAPLRAALRAWAENGDLHPLFEHKVIIVIQTPIERVPGRLDGTATKAFLTDRPSGELAEAMGAILRAHGQLSVPIGPVAPDEAMLQLIPIGAVDVHRRFDRSIARLASGLPPDESPLAITLIGAGALGSQFAITAAREGFGRWSVIDPDHLMPHNLARHALSHAEVGIAKAQGVADNIRGLLGPGAASAYVARVQDTVTENGCPFLSADLVVDASASVPTARWLACESSHTARTVSIFFNPRGTDLVVLQEGLHRSPRLDHLEMSYYWQLVCDPDMRTHLHSGTSILPSGGCRTLSLQLPQSRVGAFAALAVKSVLERPLTDGGFEIWRMTDNGIAVCRTIGEVYHEAVIGGWTVAVRNGVVAGIAEAREAAGRCETGGVLVGTCDRERRRLYIVGHFDPPLDSEHSTSGFVRGMVGVHETLEAVEAATAANLSYIGEWHTHPPGNYSSPSGEDKRLLRWVGDALLCSDIPAVMLIAGDDGLRLLLSDETDQALLPLSSNTHSHTS